MSSTGKLRNTWRCLHYRAARLEGGLSPHSEIHETCACGESLTGYSGQATRSWADPTGHSSATPGRSVWGKSGPRSAELRRWRKQNCALSEARRRVLALEEEVILIGPGGSGTRALCEKASPFAIPLFHTRA